MDTKKKTTVYILEFATGLEKPEKTGSEEVF